MTNKSDYLAEARQNFAKRWAPDPHFGKRRDFEIALDQLIYAAVALGQEPFVRELELFRDLTLKDAALSHKTVIMPLDSQVKSTGT